MTDNEVIKAILAGNKDVFEELLNKYEGVILRYCNRLLNFNQADAEDITAQTFVKAYYNLAGFNPSLKFSSWLYRIAHNEGVNLIKKKSNYYIVNITDLNSIDTPQDTSMFEQKDILERILAQLTLEDRNLLILFYLEDRTMQEIGEILKISNNNVAVKLNRARNKARKIVENQRKNC